MKRNDFLKGAGLMGLGLSLPDVIKKNPSLVVKGLVPPPDACTLIPTETAGPFPLDLTANTNFFRQDIREAQQGVRLNLRMKIIGAQNCAPMQNVRVNVWHCTKDGIYSGYNTSNNPGTTDSKYLRGYQFTDANGFVDFVTIFPGWYTGRIAHIHFQVYVSSNYAAVSQMTFDIATKNAIYTANPSIYTKGADPLSYNSDNIFSDGYALQIASLTPNTTTGGYDAYLEVTVQGSGISAVGHLEKETAKVFTLGQNFPNPFTDRTTIPVSLKQKADVRLDIYDLQGLKVATVFESTNQGAGELQLEFSPRSFGLGTGNYMYQFEASTSEGRFTLPKMMTAVK